MKGITALFLGIFGTFAFSWAGMVLLPNYQIGHLDPQMEEEDVYPAPKSGMAERGRKVYAANGCVYCHSQQVRADYASSDIERKWGTRRSAPRDYLFERPVVLGKMRIGPDLANIGKRAPVEEETAPPTSAAPAAPAATNPSPGTSPPVSAAPENPATTPAANAQSGPASAAASPAPPANSATPVPAASPATTTVAANDVPAPYSAAWHHRHLYSPRSLVLDSNMPEYHFLYEKRRISGERSADALKLGEEESVPAGWEVVPTYDAKCLVAYLMSLDQSHPLKEAKAAGAPPAPAAPAPAPTTKEAK